MVISFVATFGGISFFPFEIVTSMVDPGGTAVPADGDCEIT